MITPKEIQEIQFAKGVRGYKEDEVDVFLDKLTTDLESMIAEKERLEGELVSKNAELDRFRGTEENVFKTLDAAKNLLGDISLSAEKRAEIIIKNAEFEAEQKIKEAEQRVKQIYVNSKEIQENYMEFSKKYKALLEDEIIRLDGVAKDFSETLSEK